MKENKQYIQSYIVPQQCILKRHTLNVDKIENLEDCKKVLSFLCNYILQPIPEGVEYKGFSEVKQYFN